MEFLLNILWLALALPAVLICWRDRGPAGNPGRIGCFQVVVLAGCLLMLVFPVVSVSDDLHSMSAEIEEFGALKRTLKQAVATKSLTNFDKELPARLYPALSFRPENRPCGTLLESSDCLPEQIAARAATCRAPPAS